MVKRVAGWEQENQMFRTAVFFTEEDKQSYKPTICVVFLLRDCGSVQGTCKDEASIMYAWARNAPPTKLPKGENQMGG